MKRRFSRWPKLALSAVTTAGMLGGMIVASTPSSAATKSPIKLMVITSVNNPASNHPESYSAAEAAARSINARGGVNGHKINIVTCNDQYTPTVAAQCGRTAVADHVVADSGTLSVLSDSINPILQQAGIASVGGIPITDSDDTNPISFPIEAALGWGYFAAVQAMADKGITKIGFALLSATPALNLADPVEQALQEGKIKTPTGQKVQYVGQSLLSVTAADYATYLLALKNDGATGIIPIALVSQTVGMIQTAAQLNLGFTWGNDTETFFPSVLSPIGPSASSVVIAGSLPSGVTSTSFVGIRRFQKDMETACKQGVANTCPKTLWTDAAVDSWLSVYTIAEIASGMKGAITNATFLHALRTSKNLYMQGLTPPWTPNKPGPSAAYIRISNPVDYFFKPIGTTGQLALTSRKSFPVETILP